MPRAVGNRAGPEDDLLGFIVQRSGSRVFHRLADVVELGVRKFGKLATVASAPSDIKKRQRGPYTRDRSA
jgi:hypothetical protein